jgi:hypothetical protein
VVTYRDGRDVSYLDEIHRMPPGANITADGSDSSYEFVLAGYDSHVMVKNSHARARA